MTTSINYGEIGSSVAAELDALRIEKEQLLRQQQTVEQRLAAIFSHEAKLRRVAESLADLLAGDDFGAANPENAVAPATPTTHAALAAAETSEPVVPREAIKVAADKAPVADEPPRSVEQTNEIAESANDSAANEAASTVGQSDGESVAAQPAADNSSGRAKQPKTLRTEDFAASDFFARFPHIADTHPVHILAAKLLEYFERGLKLHEIAQLIESLGYKHNSRNFTDSVHSALKNKRKATGEFRFNAAKSVWELSHWYNEQLPTVEKGSSAETAVASERATTPLTRQVETQIAKQLSRSTEKTLAAASETIGTTFSAKKVGVGKGAAIKVYKPQRQS